MAFINAFRIRIVVFVLVILLLWQIFRNWPSDGEYHQVNIPSIQ